MLAPSATDGLVLAEEHAALRRLAMLVARQPSPDEVFTAITAEVGSVLVADFAAMLTFDDDRKVTVIASWSAAGQRAKIGTRLPLDGDSVADRIFQTGAPARMDSYVDVVGHAAQFARDLGVRSTVGAPIVVQGKLWGALLAATRGREPLLDTAEARLSAFTELVSTTISNAEARYVLQRVGAEQEALRKAAVLVASGASPTEVFAVITASAAEVFGAPFASLIRVGADETATMVAGCETCSAYVGNTWTVPADDPGITRTVLDSRRPSRIEDHSRVHGPVGEAARELGLGSVAGAPVIVDGSVWGVLAVGAARSGPPMAPDAADRLADFAELVSTAIGNTEAHDQVRRLLDEQAALRRVATLVARGVSPADVFAAVTDEVGGLFGSEAAIARFEPDGSSMVVVGLTKGIPVVAIGDRWKLESFLASSAVYRTGRPARSDHSGHRDASGTVAENLRKMDFVSTVAAPIVVEGNLWGVMTASDRREPLPPDTEERVAKFSELVATAIANAESRAELAASEARARELASEQAALRRVATLVAEGATPTRVFDAVRLEVARMFDIPSTVLMRFDADGMATLLATYSDYLGPVGTRWPLEGDTSAVAKVHDTGRAARADYTRHVHGSLAQAARRGGVRYPVAVPVVVEGALWGAVSAGSYGPAPPPADLEDRLAKFTELLATAIANAETRAELDASRARIVTTADRTRRQIERDLHDGIQQGLVTLALKARQSAASSDSGDPARKDLSAFADDLVAVVDELREISRGIHPAILSDAGIDDALRALARRSSIPVVLDVSFGARYEPSIEATVYYVAAESITNAVKHAHASVISVRGDARDGAIELEIRDDGVGGAEASRGSGIIGLKDRVDTLGGTMSISSPAGAGTTVHMILPEGPRADGDQLVRPGASSLAPASG